VAKQDFQNLSHATGAGEQGRKFLASAHRVTAFQILPAQSGCQFPEDAFEEEAIGEPGNMAAIYAVRIKPGMKAGKNRQNLPPL
jgi:hypothetical protein